MVKVKYLIPVVLSLAVVGCSSEPKELTDEEYFSIMNAEIDIFMDAWNTVAEPMLDYSRDNSQYEQMREPAEQSLATYDKEIEKIKNIKAVPGWEERHEQLIAEATYFQGMAREILRTSKHGDLSDLLAQTRYLEEHIHDIRSLAETYERAQ